jgi:hypothetical protein
MGDSRFVKPCIPDALKSRLSLFGRAGWRRRRRIFREDWGGKDRMDAFPFIHQPEAVHFHLFSFLVQAK